jgi:CheY-like chemotaxis protein
MVREEAKKDWDKFLKGSDISTISSLIRQSVKHYIKEKGLYKKIDSLSNFEHELKQDLSSIKGFSQLLIEENKDKFEWDVLLKIKEIYDKSVNIQRILNKIFDSERINKENYDVLIIDDDESTIHLLTDFFNNKGVSTNIASSASDAFNLLKYTIPKLILVDVLLPGKDGYEICRQLRSEARFKDVPIYYITAVQENEVRSKATETGADGYFLKPFDMRKFRQLYNNLKEDFRGKKYS